MNVALIHYLSMKLVATEEIITENCEQSKYRAKKPSLNWWEEAVNLKDTTRNIWEDLENEMEGGNGMIILYSQIIDLKKE